MKQDKIMTKIHQTQTQLKKKHKDLSWNQDVKLIDQIAKKVAKKYNYHILPMAKNPNTLSSAVQHRNYEKY